MKEGDCRSYQGLQQSPLLQSRLRHQPRDQRLSNRHYPSPATQTHSGLFQPRFARNPYYGGVGWRWAQWGRLL